MSACVNSCFLLKFLRARKFDVQKAAELYKNYYDKRSLLCGFDRLQDSSTFKQGITDLAKNYGDFIAVLDEPDSCGRKIIICRENVFQERVLSKMAQKVRSKDENGEGSTSAIPPLSTTKSNSLVLGPQAQLSGLSILAQ